MFMRATAANQRMSDLGSARSEIKPGMAAGSGISRQRFGSLPAQTGLGTPE